ncbi:hypothetical protein [Litchfieldia alkalitelluris]|uniref:hypothetical protein n=1 Tax=Litchfieldia alkalitelluris TaxID=304268 RepID=UPI0009963BD9|nr:hypothetical protein [Litchfieldia alkalitelluris]
MKIPSSKESFSLTKNNEVSLKSIKNGQLFIGKVLKEVSNQTVLIQTNGHQLLAQSEMKLEINKRYIFQAFHKDQKIYFKMIKDNKSKPLNTLQDTNTLIGQIISTSKINNSKLNRQLLSIMLNENLPFTENELKHIARWIEYKNDHFRAIESIKLITTNAIPINNDSLDGIYSILNKESMSTQLLKLQNQLIVQTASKDSNLGSLISTISKILNFNPIPKHFLTGENSAVQFTDLLKTLGLMTNTHNMQGSNPPIESLKQQLNSVLWELQDNKPLSENIKQLIQRIYGMELLSQDNEYLQQILVQTPIKLGDFLSDLTIQWSGQKDKEGKINVDHCHILFYLQLQHIGETVIDLRIQNRVINVLVYNKFSQLLGVLEQLKPSLKENLEQYGYTLSAVKLTIPKNNHQGLKAILSTNQLYSTNFNGVDLRV